MSYASEAEPLHLVGLSPAIKQAVPSFLLLGRRLRSDGSGRRAWDSILPFHLREPWAGRAKVIAPRRRLRHGSFALPGLRGLGRGVPGACAAWLITAAPPGLRTGHHSVRASRRYLTWLSRKR